MKPETATLEPLEVPVEPRLAAMEYVAGPVEPVLAPVDKGSSGQRLQWTKAPVLRGSRVGYGDEKKFTVFFPDKCFSLYFLKLRGVYFLAFLY